MTNKLIDLGQIRTKLFGCGQLRQRIAQKYGVEVIGDPAEFERSLLESFGQAERSMESVSYDNDEVFRAAVRALASNSRDWRVFVDHEADIADLLGNYNAAAASRLGAAAEARLQRLLPGITSSADARAIFAWAGLLSGEQRCDDHLRALQEELRSRAVAKSVSVSEPMVTAMVAVAVGHGVSWPNSHPFPRKMPGMGPILASEFLRNLGWSGFKPDRHVKKLLAKWFPCDQQVDDRAKAVASVLGVRARPVHEFLYFSILGAERSPPGLPISQVDNLVWLYGATERLRRSIGSRLP